QYSAEYEPLGGAEYGGPATRGFAADWQPRQYGADGSVERGQCTNQCRHAATDDAAGGGYRELQPVPATGSLSVPDHGMAGEYRRGYRFAVRRHNYKPANADGWQWIKPSCRRLARARLFPQSGRSRQQYPCPSEGTRGSINEPLYGGDRSRDGA